MGVSPATCSASFDEGDEGDSTRPCLTARREAGWHNTETAIVRSCHSPCPAAWNRILSPGSGNQVPVNLLADVARKIDEHNQSLKVAVTDNRDRATGTVI